MDVIAISLIPRHLPLQLVPAVPLPLLVNVFPAWHESRQIG